MLGGVSMLWGVRGLVLEMVWLWGGLHLQIAYRVGVWKRVGLEVHHGRTRSVEGKFPPQKEVWVASTGRVPSWWSPGLVRVLRQ